MVTWFPEFVPGSLGGVLYYLGLEPVYLDLVPWGPRFSPWVEVPGCLSLYYLEVVPGHLGVVLGY